MNGTFICSGYIFMYTYSMCIGSAIWKSLLLYNFKSIVFTCILANCYLIWELPVKTKTPVKTCEQIQSNKIRSSAKMPRFEQKFNDLQREVSSRIHSYKSLSEWNQIQMVHNDLNVHKWISNFRLFARNFLLIAWIWPIVQGTRLENKQHMPKNLSFSIFSMFDFC